ncbi:MAG TPA: hypothetical protein VNP20_03065 [Nocardioidaceae bacterium]|nr:hypothetical protein [Nocardioidaceae bacterium]
MTRTLFTTSVATSVATLAAAGLLTPATALANDGDVERTGPCSSFGRYDLKLSPENRGIEVEFEVDVNRSGQRYRVKMFHNGRRFEDGVYRTRGRSGSFTVRDVEPYRAGRDRFRVRAVRLGGGQRCVGRAQF